MSLFHSQAGCFPAQWSIRTESGLEITAEMPRAASKAQVRAAVRECLDAAGLADDPIVSIAEVDEYETAA